MPSHALRNGLIVALSCVFAQAIVGCGSNGEQASGTAEAQAKREPLPAATTPAGKLVVAYLAVQQALIRDDVGAAGKGFLQVKAAAQAPTTVADVALRDRVVAAAQAGAAAKDLPGARKAFDTLTGAALDFLRATANPVNTALHVAHCPMAFDGAGADWLQTGNEVTNPYYGSEMLGCGSLGAEIRPGQKLVAK